MRVDPRPDPLAGFFVSKPCPPPRPPWFAIGGFFIGKTTMTDQLLRRKEVRALIGLSETALKHALRDGRFPQPCQLGPRCYRWRTSDIESWIAGLPEKGATPATGA